VADISRDMNLTCRVVRAQPEFVGKQGHLCAPAISAETVGARKIHLQIVRIPAGGLAKAHKHEGHETALHIISGKSVCGTATTCNSTLSLAPETFSISRPICLTNLTI